MTGVTFMHDGNAAGLEIDRQGANHHQLTKWYYLCSKT